VDFLNVGIGPLRTGIFNVADMAIMLGVALLIAGLRAMENAEDESA
jgi:signal peptidase II